MIQERKKKIHYIFIGIGAILWFLLLAVFALFGNELRSLMSLKKIDDYGMYQMMYYGDYGFDEFLEKGAASDADIEAFAGYSKSHLSDGGFFIAF